MSIPEPLLVEVVRSGFVESVHRVRVVLTDGSGRVVRAHGPIDAPVFPRSTNKPLQAVGLLRAGLDVDGELLALAAASHSGQPEHLDGVRRLLAVAGLDPTVLQTPPELPLDEVAAADVLRAGGRPTPLAMNCSGKHAAMLVTAARNGWDLDSYLDPDHPVQRAVRAAVEDLAGESAAAVGVDGCGAPLFALRLTAVARGFARLAGAAPGTPEARVAAAMTGWPTMVGGTGRDVTRLLRTVPGLVAKDGAEGVYAAALPDGRAVALKVEDGGHRPRAAVLTTALDALGVDAPGLTDIGHTPVLGHGRPVGEVRVRW